MTYLKTDDIVAILTMELLKKKCEKLAGEEFLDFPGTPTAKNFYRPVRANKDNKRYWLIFKAGNPKDIAIFGDFKTGNKQSFQIDFPIKNIKYASTEPITEKMIEERISNINMFLNTLKTKSHNNYTMFYDNIVPKTYVKDSILYIPFSNIMGKVTAIQKINHVGTKRWIKGSITTDAFHPLKKPKENDILYLTEGINTGYAALTGCPEGSGVICVGSFQNMENCIKLFKDSKYRLCLCFEPANYTDYIELKDKYKCLMVGSVEHSDLDDFYKKTNKYLLKKLMISFNEQNFLPLGISPTNKILTYNKTLNDVAEYGKNEGDTFYCDAHNVEKVPAKENWTNFYWKTRHVCRKIGPVKTIKKVREGVFKKDDDYYFYNMHKLYLLKNNDLSIIDPLSIINPDLILIRQHTKKFPDLSKIQPLTQDELIKLFSFFKLFNFSDAEKKLILGWVIQGCICGGLSFRPPIWIVAPSGTGKSKLTQEYLTRFFAHFEHKVGRSTTTMWLPREFNGRAIPLHRDEYEPVIKHKNSTIDDMEFIRASATARYSERGISAGAGEDTLVFTYCLTALFSSCKTPKELTDADRNRIIFFDMKKNFNSDFYDLLREFKKIMTLKMQYRFLKTCLLKMPQINKDFEDLTSDINYSSIRSHKKSSYFTLMACFNNIMPNHKIKIKEIADHILAQYKEELRSKILVECLDLILKKSNYSITQNMSFFDVLCNDLYYKTILKPHKIYLYKDMLLIHPQKSSAFLKQLFNENGQYIEKEDLKEKLCSDGELLIKTLQIGKIKTGDLTRGDYLCFNLNAIRRRYE